jgi:hypothetical protein
MGEHELEQPDYGGMTVNERLFTAGLLESFDSAARARNRAEMISILLRVQLSEKDAAWSVDTILANPRSYGF